MIPTIQPQRQQAVWTVANKLTLTEVVSDEKLCKPAVILAKRIVAMSLISVRTREGSRRSSGKLKRGSIKRSISVPVVDCCWWARK